MKTSKYVHKVAVFEKCNLGCWLFFILIPSLILNVHDTKICRAAGGVQVFEALQNHTKTI